jgi:hypothetical protein
MFGVVTGVMMRRMSLLLFVTVMAAAVPLAAQEAKSYFVVTVPAFKIYAHERGYIFTYQKNSAEIGRLFLPYEWFRTTSASVSNEEPLKGFLKLLDKGNTWPSISIFYSEGQFSYVKLYVRPEATHESWGSIMSGNTFEAEFGNADPPVLNFVSSN